MKTFTPFIDWEIGTFTMFKSSFPNTLGLENGALVDKDDFGQLDSYNKDKEIKLTKEEMEEIMRGDSVHNIPEWKRQELIAKYLEQQRQEKIDRVMKKELDKLNEKFIKKMQEQDDAFAERIANIKPKK